MTVPLTIPSVITCRRYSTRTILIEPNPFAFARLQKTYAGMPNVALIQTAIADHDGEAQLYRVRNTGKSDSEVDLSLQVASFYKNTLSITAGRPTRLSKSPCPAARSPRLSLNSA